MWSQDLCREAEGRIRSWGAHSGRLCPHKERKLGHRHRGTATRGHGEGGCPHAKEAQRNHCPTWAAGSGLQDGQREALRLKASQPAALGDGAPGIGEGGGT